MPNDPKADYFVLRAEWLKFKSNLYDKNTSLPTLPIVVDDTRKMVEEHGTIGLLLVDLGKQKNFECTYGWQVYDDILREFAQILEESRSEILNERDLVAISQIRGDEFLMFLNPPAGKTWNDNGLEIVNEKMRNAIRRKMERFNGQRWHSNLTFHTGYSAIARDPTIRIERLIQRAIAKAREVSGQEIENEMIRHHIALQRIISNNAIITYFQPIVHLQDLDVLGYEALSRGPEDSGFEGTELLFTFAESTNMLLDLERLCRRNALRAAQAHHLDRKLFLNSSAKALQDTHLTPLQLSEFVAELGLKQDHIVLEITERVAIQEWESFKKVLRDFRKHGFKIAIDDMGAAAPMVAPARRAHVDATLRPELDEPGGHLAAPRVVDADEQDFRHLLGHQSFRLCQRPEPLTGEAMGEHRDEDVDLARAEQVERPCDVALDRLSREHACELVRERVCRLPDVMSRDGIEHLAHRSLLTISTVIYVSVLRSHRCVSISGA